MGSPRARSSDRAPHTCGPHRAVRPERGSHVPAHRPGSTGRRPPAASSSPAPSPPSPWAWPPAEAAAAPDAPAAAKAPDASALSQGRRRHQGDVLARHGRHQRRGADQAGRRLQQGQRRQDPGRGDLRRQVRRRDRQVQGLDPEQVHPRRRAGLRHRHPLHDRRRADRADAGLHRPRQGRHERPAAEHRRLLLGRQEALLDAVQHLDAGAVHQREAVQGGRARPRPSRRPRWRRSAPRPRSCPRRTAARPTTASARPSTAGCSSSSSPRTARSTATRATAGTARPPRSSSTATPASRSSPGGRRWSRTAWPPTPAATPRPPRPPSSPASWR